MNDKKDDVKKDVCLRLRKIEGQVKGIEKMIENDACCKEIIVQIAAIRAAINKTGAIILQNYAKNCVTNANSEVECTTSDLEKNFDELISALVTYIK